MKLMHDNYFGQTYIRPKSNDTDFSSLDNSFDARSFSAIVVSIEDTPFDEGLGFMHLVELLLGYHLILLEFSRFTVRVGCIYVGD